MERRYDATTLRRYVATSFNDRCLAVSEIHGDFETITHVNSSRCFPFHNLSPIWLLVSLFLLSYGVDCATFCVAGKSNYSDFGKKVIQSSSLLREIHTFRRILKDISLPTSGR